MIRVNLVDAVRRTEKQAGASGLQAGKKLSIAASLIFLVTALFVGWRYWAVSQGEAALDQQIASAQHEEAQLKGILQQVQTFEARRQQLQQRVALIDELRKSQSVPVHIVDQVSRALPDQMWLVSLEQAGEEITIEGECLSLTALSDFVGNLEASRYFARPVEIINSAVVPARENLPDVIRFSVKGTFQMAGLPAKPAPVGGKRG